MRVERVDPRSARARRASSGAVLDARPRRRRRALVEGPAAVRRRPRRARVGRPRLADHASLIAEPGDLHEDEAAVRLAKAVAGPGPRRSAARTRAGSTSSRRRPASSTSRSRSSSGSTGSTRSRCSRCSTARSSSEGDLVASVKVAPHLVDAGDRRGRRRAIAAFGVAADRVGRRVRRRGASGSSSRSPSGRPPASGSRRASGPRSRGSARRSSRSTTSPDDVDGRRRPRSRGSPAAPTSPTSS